MPSSYTTSLRLTLPATGELSGQWGNTVNTGITELLDAAVAGTASISTWGGAGVAYTLSNNSGTADEARKMFIVATGSPGEAKNVICPAVSKFYVFRNDTTGGFALTLKTPSGTGISVPAGQYKFLYCDGTNVVEMFNSAGALTLSGALSVGGTTTLASNPTLSAGTANQVQYLNGSKVLSGSANLTFDGTTLTGAGFSGPLNGSVGATTPSTGAFTTLSASSTVSGTGFTNLFASPPAIGSTAANTGAFTTLSASGNVTLSGGTANGVLYLNGSKVATSGTALAFNGTSLLVGKNSSDANNWGVQNYATNAFGSGMQLTYGGVGSAGLWVPAASSLAFGADAGSGTTELMRLTSTGLGIGTSSPGYKLDVNGTSRMANGGLMVQGSNLTATASQVTLDQLNSTTSRLISWGPNTATPGILSFGNLSSNASVGSASNMTLDSSGNLGIGTSSPASKLEVYNSAVNAAFVASNPATWRVAQVRNDGTANANNAAGIAFVGRTDVNPAGIVAINSTTSGGVTSLAFLPVSGNTPFEAMRLDSSGNLGLGVTPSAWNSAYRALDMGSGALMAQPSGTDIYATQNAFFGAGGTWQYKFSSVAASRYQMVAGVHSWATAPSGTAGNTISFTQAMTLDASGNLGVGTTSPARTLDVRATSPFIRIQETGSGGDKRLEFSVDSGGVATISAPQSAQVLTFNTVGSERARITSGGDLLVGTTDAAQTSGAGFKVGGAGGIGVGQVAVVGTDSTNTTVTYRLYSTGAAAYRFYVGLGGTIYATSATITSLSDQRLKENIQNIDVGLNAVMALKPRKFDWKAGKGKDKKNDRGFIAQEFEQVFPEMIDTWRDPAPEGEEPYKAVNADLIPVLVKAIQEQQALITALTARVAALEKP